jgi:hypothetical protein
MVCKSGVRMVSVTIMTAWVIMKVIATTVPRTRTNENAAYKPIRIVEPIWSAGIWIIVIITICTCWSYWSYTMPQKEKLMPISS